MLQCVFSTNENKYST